MSAHTQLDVEQTIATLRQASITLTEHATKAPQFVEADAAQLMAAWNEIAFVLISLGLVTPHKIRMTGTGKRVA